MSDTANASGSPFHEGLVYKRESYTKDRMHIVACSPLGTLTENGDEDDIEMISPSKGVLYDAPTLFFGVVGVHGLVPGLAVQQEFWIRDATNLREAFDKFQDACSAFMEGANARIQRDTQQAMRNAMAQRNGTQMTRGGIVLPGPGAGGIK